MFSCYTLIFGCFECFRFFRSVLDCLGHRGSTKPFRLCSATLVRCVVQFVLIVLRCRSIKVVATCLTWFQDGNVCFGLFEFVYVVFRLL